MKIGVLGTGMVGTRIATGLVGLGYEVMMGSRSADNAGAEDWRKIAGAHASHGTFRDAAAFGDLVFLCVKGDAALEVARLAGPESVRGKTVIDLTNPLDFSRGMPPALFVSNTDSLGEQVQKALPEAHVVKTLNIVSNEVMVDPGKTGGEPTMFLCGNDAHAKKEAAGILARFGWKDILDLGDITNARGTEMILPIWLRVWGVLQDGKFAFKVLRKS
jgi:8-hydroxy-5-deazaflavin:NADPH oxidoreductase